MRTVAARQTKMRERGLPAPTVEWWWARHSCTAQTTVGASLLAMASAHSTLMWQGDCHRGQALLPQGSGGGRSIYVRRRPLWEPGLPAMASAHSTLMWQGEDSCSHPDALQLMSIVDSRFLLSAHQTTPAPPLTTPPQAWSTPRSPARSPGHAGSGNAHPVRASARRTMPGPR